MTMERACDRSWAHKSGAVRSSERNGRMHGNDSVYFMVRQAMTRRTYLKDAAGSMPAGMQATETNQFGIHEFMRLCRLVGAEPYVAGNVGSGTPHEFHDFVSYCNAPAGTLTLADERAANGDRDAFGVRYWGVGNEAWGCGGTMRPGEYAAHYRVFTSQFPSYVEPFLIAVGPRGHDPDQGMSWTTGFFEAMRGD